MNKVPGLNLRGVTRAIVPPVAVQAHVDAPPPYIPVEQPQQMDTPHYSARTPLEESVSVATSATSPRIGDAELQRARGDLLGCRVEEITDVATLQSKLFEARRLFVALERHYEQALDVHKNRVERMLTAMSNFAAVGAAPGWQAPNLQGTPVPDRVNTSGAARRGSTTLVPSDLPSTKIRMALVQSRISSSNNAGGAITPRPTTLSARSTKQFAGSVSNHPYQQQLSSQAMHASKSSETGAANTSQQMAAQSATATRQSPRFNSRGTAVGGNVGAGQQLGGVTPRGTAHFSKYTPATRRNVYERNAITPRF